MIGVTVTATDITERINHERTLEAEGRVREDILHIASHELRTPLTGIVAFAQRLARAASLIEQRPLATAQEAIGRTARASSLQRLNEFPVQTLKIDRSFVQALAGTGRGALPILKSIVAVGHALGLDVLAEGVESEIQTHVLRGISCDLGQGFLFSHPVPEAAMRDLLATGVEGMSRLVA